MADDAELVIGGGGLNGMLLAVACAGAGLSTIVIDRQDPATMTADRCDGRTSAIAYGSRLVFDGIGLWPAIEREAEPIREIRVADDDSPLFLHYDHRELGGSAPLGYIVENRVLRRALFDRAAILPSLKLRTPLDRRDRGCRSRAASPGPVRPRVRGRAAHAVWRFSRACRAGRAALELPALADAGRALCRPAPGAGRRGGACDPPDRRPGTQ